eukprot:gene30635-25833_t
MWEKRDATPEAMSMNAAIARRSCSPCTQFAAASPVTRLTSQLRWHAARPRRDLPSPSHWYFPSPGGYATTWCEGRPGGGSPSAPCLGPFSQCADEGRWSDRCGTVTWAAAGGAGPPDPVARLGAVWRKVKGA